MARRAQCFGGDAPVFLELEWTPWDLILALRVLEEKGEASLPILNLFLSAAARSCCKVPVVLKTKTEAPL